MAEALLFPAALVDRAIWKLKKEPTFSRSARSEYQLPSVIPHICFEEDLSNMLQGILQKTHPLPSWLTSQHLDVVSHGPPILP